MNKKIPPPKNKADKQHYTHTNVLTHERLEWIDVLKSFLIIGVVFFHTPGHPEWWTASHVNSVFFFIAGIFFKPRSFKCFISWHFKSLIIPFIIFYLLSIPFRLIVDFWDCRSFSNLKYTMIFDLLHFESKSDYLYANVPLWFLLCLFWVQIYWWVINKLPTTIQYLLLICIFFFRESLNSIPSLFMMNNALCWTLYFGIGKICGKVLIQICSQSYSKALVILALALGLMSLVFFIDNNYHIFLTIFYISWCLVLLSFFSLLRNVNIPKMVMFWGVNSLIILGTHLWVLIPLQRIQFMLTRSHNEWLALIICLLCSMILIPVVNMFVKILPTKNKVFPIKQHENTISA